MTNIKNPFENIRDTETEMKVLGTIMADSSLYRPGMLREDYFEHMKCKKIFSVMKELFSQGLRIDDLALYRAKGVKANELSEVFGSSENWGSSHLIEDIKVLEKYAVYRRVVTEIEEIKMKAQMGGEDVQKFLAETNEKIVRIMEDFKEDKSSAIKDVLDRLTDTREKFKSGEISGFKTGIETLDRLTGGMLPRFVFIVGAYTNSYKSFFALQVILNALKQGKRCALFSLEMSDLINASRMLGNITGIGSLEVFQGTFDSEQFQENMKWLSDQKLLVYDNKMSMEEIKSECIKESMLRKLDLVVIDYVQNLMDEKEIYSNMVNAVKSANFIAQKTNAAILLVSQISNEGAKGRVGSVISYKGAGELAAGPDVGLFLEKVEEHKQIVQDVLLCRIRKNRHGPLGRVWLQVDTSSGFIREHDDQLDCSARFKIRD